MDRISTASSYASVLQNLMQSEIAQTNAGLQLSTNEKATDLSGYGTSAETLTSMQATQTQVTGYLNNTQNIAAKLATQDSALTEVAGASTSAIQAITQSIAEGNGTTLMQQLQDSLSSATEGLNTQYNGEYLFAGGQVNTQPVSASTLSQLTAGPPISSVFNNDQRVTVSQLDQNTQVSTGFLADQVGTPLFTALQAIQAYAQGPNGPFTGTLTQAQSQFLSSQIAGLTTVQTNLNNVVAQNGLAQNEVTNAQSDLTSRQTMLQELIGNVTGADVAQATTNLQQAQLSIQAAGQVFQALNNSSLLDSLTAVPAL
ncbi:MAG TPA: flagellin [Caulobacteraceae bacterium]|jgi:flagellar hook-associated protein 3 FlgL|nr:flagellin [Caulobacteraceae bacterium]